MFTEQELQKQELRKNYMKEYHHNYYEENKDKIKEYDRNRYEENKDKIKEYRHKYYAENKDKIKECQRSYDKNNKDKKKKKQREYYINNTEKIKKYHDEYYAANFDRTILAWILNKYEGIPCMDCMGIFVWRVMDFDHRPEELKSFNVASRNRLIATPERIAEIQKEIDKCDLVCANCHRMRTMNRCFLNNEEK